MFIQLLLHFCLDSLTKYLDWLNYCIYYSYQKRSLVWYLGIQERNSGLMLSRRKGVASKNWDRWFLPDPQGAGGPQGRGTTMEGQKMLILTRRVGEKLIIGDDVIVTILSLKGNQIRIGIDAPREIKVHRQEVYERIQKEREKLSVVSSRGGFNTR